MRIFPLGNSKFFFLPVGRRGVTLLELVVVLLILSTAVGLGVSSVNRRENQIKKTLRQFMALNRQLHSQARLKRVPYRWVFDLSGGRQSWWVESLQVPPEKEGGQVLASAFVLDRGFMEKPQKLPGSLEFAAVEFSRRGGEPSRQGRVYVSYFPEGHTERVVVRLRGMRQSWSFFIDRFLGKSRIFLGEKTLKDFQQ